MALSSVDVVPKMVQALLRQLETVPLGQKTEVGVLHLAVSLGVLWEHSPPPPQTQESSSVLSAVRVLSAGGHGTA